MICAVCRRDQRTKKLTVIHKRADQVYPSPSKRSMETKISDEIITFPLLYFSIDDFDQRFEDVVVGPNQCVCVELVAEISDVSPAALASGASSVLVQSWFPAIRCDPRGLCSFFSCEEEEEEARKSRSQSARLTKLTGAPCTT